MTATNLMERLRKATAYEHHVGTIDMIETHISWVLLAGSFAYKIKKPVNFGFLDFSTLPKRKQYCDEELRLNRRLAAELYLQVVPITGTVDNPKIDGEGDAIEYAVKMRRFANDQLLSELSNQGQLSVDIVDQIADLVATFHDRVDVASKSAEYGKPEDIHHWFRENFEHIRPLLDSGGRQQQLQRLQQWGQEQWQSNLAMMRRRQQGGFIRECHGDLHLGNMVLIDGEVTAFDCIEFNEQLRWIDVLSEVAFVMMDLHFRGYDGYAYRFLNRYLAHSGDYQSLPLLHYYLVYRAMVRAKVAALQKIQQLNDESAAAALQSTYAAYADLAEKLTQGKQVKLLIMHGFSGSGKSTFAAQLAESLEAIWLRSDIERKRLFGLQADAHSASAINSGLYSAEVSTQTYRRLADLSRLVLAAGFSVVVDAAFLASKYRNMFQELAGQEHVPLLILDCYAPEKKLFERIEQRIAKADDPSEATAAVLRQQMRTAELLSEQELKNTLTVDTLGDNALKDVIQRISSI